MTMVIIFTAILAAVSITYGLVLLGFFRGLRNVRLTKRFDHAQWPMVSVVMPARNEADVLERTLRSVFLQDYPGDWEIIVVDDRSSDRTPQLLQELAASQPRLRSFRVNTPHPPSPKKNALALGIQQARGDIIVTTDADCEYNSGWLKAMISYMGPEVGVVAGLTVFDLPGAPVPHWQKIQWLDFVTQQYLAAGAIGAGVPSSCNGSNLAYRRSVYDQISGFGASANQVSGDDVLFAQRVAKLTEWRIVFAAAPEAVVKSLPVYTIPEMFNQRFRWASKGLTYRKSMLFFLFGMYVYYLMWIASPVVMLLHPAVAPAIALIAGWKLLWDYVTIRLGCRMFQQEYLLRYFLPFVVLHTLFTPVFGIGGLLVPYRWKGGWYRTATLPRDVRRKWRKVRRHILHRRAAHTNV
jgi:cellulose synthase/poly-beta-1,6-N-acetylglucosamine synthase-like glycosyltransferase